MFNNLFIACCVALERGRLSITFVTFQLFFLQEYFEYRFVGHGFNAICDAASQLSSQLPASTRQPTVLLSRLSLYSSSLCVVYSRRSHPALCFICVFVIAQLRALRLFSHHNSHNVSTIYPTLILDQIFWSYLKI